MHFVCIFDEYPNTSTTLECLLCPCVTFNKLTYFNIMVASTISESMDVSGDQSMLQSHEEHREEPLLGE